MKNAKILTAAIFFFSALYADVQIPETLFQKKLDLQPIEDELVAIERMISLTEKQQAAQIKLKYLIKDIRHNKELFMKGDQTKLHAKYMIEAAAMAYSIIKEYHLEHLFASDYLEELALFKSIGKTP